MTQNSNEIMEAYTVIFDGLEHLGPGDADTTRGLIERLGPDLPPAPRIADFGCGVGASSLVLAQSLPQARVLALDAHAPFVSRLNIEADARGLGDQIHAVAGDMAQPPPLDGIAGEFDLIWSESAIYSIGRSQAFSCWRPLLKPGGWLVFSDIVWQKDQADRSPEASTFWETEYPEITTADAVLDQLVASGYRPLDPILVGQEVWSNYYEPLRERLHALESSQLKTTVLNELISGINHEITVYDRSNNEVAVVFFIARKDTAHQ